MRQEKNNRSNRQDQEQARKRNQATRNAGQMANDLLRLRLTFMTMRTISGGNLCRCRERYDHCMAKPFECQSSGRS